MLRMLIPTCILALSCTSGPSSDWTYPVSLGMSRDSAEALLGPPDRAAHHDSTVHYPQSGVDIRYSASGRVQMLRLHAFAGGEFLRSTSEIAHGIRATDSLDSLYRKLGAHSSVDTSNVMARLKETYWKRDRLVVKAISASFSNEDWASSRWQNSRVMFIEFYNGLP